MVPTTRAVRRDRFSIGQCRNEQLRHLGASPWRVWKLKVKPCRRMRLQPAQTVATI